jgi:hypothetical protein
MQVIQSALCGRVRELTTQHESDDQRIHQLNGQSLAARQAIQARNQELAALRYAILEAKRVGTHISRERHQVECSVVEGWKRLISTLNQTPLSMTQRGLLGEIIGALDGWRSGRAEAANGVEFQVESPALHRCEFNCAEVIESALAAVRKNAQETGAQVETALVNPVPQCLHGSPQHIHQLITLLAASLTEVVGSLEVQVSFQANQDGPELLLSFLTSTVTDESLYHRLATLVEGSPTLRRVPDHGAELALTSAWQLALALGGSPSIERTSDRKARLQISLPGGDLSQPSIGAFSRPTDL